MRTERFQGACDASAATLIAGTPCFVTASDEDYVLRVYDSRSPGLPIGEVDVTTFLDSVDRKKEPDIEGSAQIETRIYWIGSHGRDKDGMEQESRQRLFATDVKIVSGRPELQPIGRPYKRLLNDLATAQDLAEFGLTHAATLPPEAPGGLNIEGLASTLDGHLLAGLRNPIPKGRALIIRIANPAAVIEGTRAAEVTQGALLDLGNRGVRAIEPTLNGRYFILAGAFDDRKDFALFLWDGVSSTPTQLLDGTTLNELNPEELLALPEAPGSLQLFSDDGDMLVGVKKCKKADLSARSFRASMIQLVL